MREHSFALSLSVQADFIDANLEVDKFTILILRVPGEHVHCCPTFNREVIRLWRESEWRIELEVGRRTRVFVRSCSSSTGRCAKERHHVRRESLRVYERVGGGRQDTRREQLPLLAPATTVRQLPLQRLDFTSERDLFTAPLIEAIEKRASAECPLLTCESPIPDFPNSIAAIHPFTLRTLCATRATRSSLAVAPAHIGP